MPVRSSGQKLLGERIGNETEQEKKKLKTKQTESKGDVRLQRPLVFTKVMKLQSKRRGCSPVTLRPGVRCLTFCNARINIYI